MYENVTKRVWNSITYWTVQLRLELFPYFYLHRITKLKCEWHFSFTFPLDCLLIYRQKIGSAEAENYLIYKHKNTLYFETKFLLSVCGNLEVTLSSMSLCWFLLSTKLESVIKSFCFEDTFRSQVVKQRYAVALKEVKITVAVNYFLVLKWFDHG